MGRHRAPDKHAPTATDLIAQLALADEGFGVTPTTEIPRVVGHKLPPIPVRVRWVSGAAAAGMFATSLVPGDIPAQAAEAPTVEIPSLNVAPVSDDEEAKILAANFAARADQEEAAKAAQAVQAAAEKAAQEAADRKAAQAESDRRAAEAVQASRAAREAKQAQEAAAVAATPPAATKGSGAGAIVPGSRITTGYEMRWGEMHWGVDLAAPLGTPIFSPVAGKVVKAGPASGFGNAVYIQDANGDVWVFGHMKIMDVFAGDTVSAGDQIARVGAEGQSTGPHCHVELHLGGINGTKADPSARLGL